MCVGSLFLEIPDSPSPPRTARPLSHPAPMPSQLLPAPAVPHSTQQPSHKTPSHQPQQQPQQHQPPRLLSNTPSDRLQRTQPSHGATEPPSSSVSTPAASHSSPAAAPPASTWTRSVRVSHLSLTYREHDRALLKACRGLQGDRALLDALTQLPAHVLEHRSPQEVHLKTGP